MNLKVKKRVQDVLNACGLTTKVKEKTMSNEDWKAFNTAYKETFKITLEEDALATTEEETLAVSEELQNEIINLAEGFISSEKEEEEEEEEEREKGKKTKRKTQKAENEEEEEEEKGKKTKRSAMTFQDACATLASIMPMLAGAPESSKPSGIIQAVDNSVVMRVLGMTPHTQTHLFGIEDPIFSRSSWFNQSIITKKATGSNISGEDAEKFADTFRDFTKSLKARADHLADSNQIKLLDFEQMAAGQTSIQYHDLTIEFGKEYMVRRQDMVIAYLRTLPTVDHIFPWRSNIQDGEIIPTAFFGELSQRYQPGEIWKGSVELPPQLARVSDVMVKFKFEDMIKLEKQYIGYLNKEHSDVIKWAFIEWLLIHFYKQMLNEQNRRRVVGELCPIQTGVDNPANTAANGALWAIEHNEETFKILPFKTLKVYNKSTIVDYVETFFEEVNQVLDSLDGWKLYINSKHIPWYRQAFREKYGTNIDFVGSKLQAIDYSIENFIPVPNMANNDFRMWMTLPGNIESLQDGANEMYNMYFERRLEALMAISRWKEGSAVNMTGYPCANEEELESTGRKLQWLFTNFPVTELAKDATTIDCRENTRFITGANSKDTEITDISNAPADRTIKIICGSLTEATTIAKKDKFKGIKSAWTPVAVGDWIKLYAELEVASKEINGVTIQVTQPTGNWLEHSRRVTVSE